MIATRKPISAAGLTAIPQGSDPVVSSATPPLNQRAREVDISLRGGGEAHLDLLETQLHQLRHQGMALGLRAVNDLR
jgi:hypothetical protein